jgi:hypothetical protein
MSAQPDEISKPVHGAAAGNGAPLPEEQQMVVEKVRRGFSLYECAPLPGVSYQTAYGWCSRYPGFGRAVAEATAEYQERLLKPVNRLIDLGADDDNWVEPAAKMGLQVLGRRFPGWHEKHQIQGDVEAHVTVEPTPVADWSQPERIGALLQMAAELGLTGLPAAEAQAAEPPTPTPEPPTTEQVVQQRLDPPPCEHVASPTNRWMCGRCPAVRSPGSDPFPRA